MYELSVAQEIYFRSRQHADEMGARELESVLVSLGELSGANPQLLRAAWKFVTSESADDNCRLEIEFRSARRTCPQCGAVAEGVRAHPAHCEHCKCHMRIERGGGVELIEIRFAQQLALS